MKKAIVASILGIAGSIATTYGQGIIFWNNFQTASYQPVIYQGGGNVNSATVELGLYYALGTYSSVGTFMAAATLGQTTFIDTTLNTDGAYNGSPQVGTGGPGGYYDPGANVVIAGWSTTAPVVTFLMQGWQTAGLNGGATYALSNLRGQSGLWTETVDPGFGNTGNIGFGIVPSTSVAGFMANGPLSTALAVVPEPTTLALAGLGGLASLVAFRRKQA